jgi:Tol biopolymer transport system component
VLNGEPPELGANNTQVPRALERLVHRCLAKEPDNRFQSAIDLAFAIDVVANDSYRSANPGIIVRQKSSQAKLFVGGVILLLLAFAGGILAHKLFSPARLSTPSIRYLTHSGRDYSPAASADGKRICFSSDRSGTKQIWVKDVVTGYETRLTDGPDDFPRFSRDGSMILFTRASGLNRALFRVPAIGGEPSKVVSDAQFGDWSTDGRQVTFVRWSEDGNSSLHIAGIDGRDESVVHRFSGRASSPRWAPNKNRIALAMNDSGRQQAVVLIDIGKRKVITTPAPHPYNLLSSVAWDAEGRHLFFMQAESGSANSGGSTAGLFRQRAGGHKFQKLLWSHTLCNVLDVLPSGNVLMDARSSRENLKQYAVARQQTSPRSLTLGNSTDRQPSYAPDGDEVVFSSNRCGNLEIWSVSRETGIFRRLTDDKGDDWDPAISSDRKNLIWSANRSGNSEIWIANADGTTPRQVAHDGFAAENPTMTADGQWIFYASTHPEKMGVWKIHPDGSGAAHFIKKTTASNAEVSPDGKYVAYVDNRRFISVVIRVAEVETGVEVPFEIRVDAAKETRALLGRVRWMPDGKSLVFLGQDEPGVHGLYVQDFVPGKDTTSTRRPFGPFDPENSAESFGISPDGQFITVATWEQFFSIMVTEDLSSL